MSHAPQQLRQITEAAAVAVAPFIGGGDKIMIDQAAVDAWHNALDAGSLSCAVVIGEGAKDEAPMLAHGKKYGPSCEAPYDLAIDPVECTSAVAKNQPGGMVVAALGRHGSFLEWANIPYMHKLVVGPGAAHLLEKEVRIDGDPARNMQAVADALGKKVKDLTVAVLDRERNHRIMFAAQQIGARLVALEGGDVTQALRTCLDGKVDMLYGSGGAPEAVLTAAFVATQGGNMQAMWDPHNQEQAQIAFERGQLGKVLGLQDLVGTGELHFAATGITSSPILEGCTQGQDGTWHPGSSILASRA